MRLFTPVIRKGSQLILLYSVLVILVLGASLFSPHFRSLENLFNILAQAVPLAFVAFGQTVVLLTSGVDLSVGGVVSIATALSAVLMKSGPFSVVLAIVAILGVGALVGLMNGASRTKLGLPPFIGTLCALMITNGIALTILPMPGGYISDSLLVFMRYEIGFCRLSVIYLLVGFLVLYAFLKYHPLGRHFYAVGGNEKAVKAAGLPLHSIVTKAHVMCGVLSAIGGLFLVSRIQSGDPNAGSTFVLDSITVVLIGGTTFTGGKGGVVGTLAGVLILAVISNALNLYAINPFFQYIVKGSLFAIAIFAYSYRRR